MQILNIFVGLLGANVVAIGLVLLNTATLNPFGMALTVVGAAGFSWGCYGFLTNKRPIPKSFDVSEHYQPHNYATCTGGL
ncbi:MAG: hypothetical protein ACOVQX_00340 [Legionella sp.]